MAVKAANNLGNVNESTAAQNKLVATAKAIPTSQREGEDLGGVGERHGTFTWRVEGPEKEDEEGDKTDMSRFRARGVETKSGGQGGSSHLGESEQE